MSIFCNSLSTIRYLAVTTVTLAVLGCDSSLQPGDQVYAVKNPTRTWEVPAELTYKTNDPKQPVFKLQLAGEVSSTVVVAPPALAAKRIRPDRTANTSVYITSQRWDDFELVEAESDLEGLTWKVEAADSEILQKLHAKCGWLLTATLPAGLPAGRLTESSIRLVAKPADAQAETRALEIPIKAQVLRRLAVYGEGIDETGTISFGVQPVGVRHHRRLIVKVHDEMPELKVDEVTTKPDFLKVALTDCDEGDSSSQRYYLDVELPAGSPEYVCRGQQLGKIVLKFDHPRIEALRLDVDFVLHGRNRQELALLGDRR